MDYAFDRPPEEGRTVEVAPGIHWLRLVLPFALDHVNVWLLRDGDGWTLVDAGLADARTREVWAGLLPGRRVVRVLATHFHPDHMGLAGWLCAETGAGLWASRTEWLMGRMLSLDGGAALPAAAAAFYRRAGLEAAALEALGRRGNAYRTRVVEPPATYRRLVDGDELTIGGRRWRVVIGRGHAPEHASLFCPELNLLLAGDQVLPRISPNVSVWASEPEADPLADFLASLERFRHLPADCLVLPSHGRPFTGLLPRIDALARHHDERLARLLAFCAAGPRTIAEAMRHLFERELDAHQTTFAVGETLAHLNYLLGRGRLERRTDAEGRYVYRGLDPAPVR